MERKYLLPYKPGEVEEGTYWISISDLMSGLLTIFILTLTWYILTYSQITTRLTESEDKRTEILHYLQEELQKHGITVKIDVANGVLHLPEHILFDPGEAKLKEKGIQAVKIVGPILEKTLINSEYYESVETVFIEGHTDNSPIFFKFPSNWELSTQRAINTWKELSQATPGLAGLKNKSGQPLFSCSGYADTRPLPENFNRTEEEKRENRRIDFRFSMATPKKEEAAQIK